MSGIRIPTVDLEDSKRRNSLGLPGWSFGSSPRIFFRVRVAGPKPDCTFRRPGLTCPQLWTHPKSWKEIKRIIFSTFSTASRNYISQNLRPQVSGFQKEAWELKWNLVKLITLGSEIRSSLDLEWSKRGWVANGPDFKWDLKSQSPTTIWNPDKCSPFCQKLSGFWMVRFFKWLEL